MKTHEKVTAFLGKHGFLPASYNINSVIEYVTDYNENKMDKEELTKLLLDYVK